MAINKGFATEYTHYEQLKVLFPCVTQPKAQGNGSDFIVIDTEGRRASFESKTSNTDIFDAGVLNIYANGMIFNSSAVLHDCHVDQLQCLINENIQQVTDYINAVNTEIVPHTTTKLLYDEIKSQGKLINITTSEPLGGLIEASFVKGNNRFAKANYIIVDNRIYCASDKPTNDPLGLMNYGAAVLDDASIAYTTIRSARSGSRNGIVSVAIRAQYRLKRILPETKVYLT